MKEGGEGGKMGVEKGKMGRKDKEKEGGREEESGTEGWRKGGQKSKIYHTSPNKLCFSFQNLLPIIIYILKVHLAVMV